MKEKSNNKKQKNTYTKEEYQKTFLPSTTKNYSFYQREPQEIGIQMANDAIAQLKIKLGGLKKKDG